MKEIYVRSIARELGVKEWQVENCVKLFDEGATIPFVSRYRKERTGGLDEVAVAEIRHWADVYAEMEKRGVMMPILDVQSKYISPAFFEEEITVRISLRELPMARITFYYEVFNEAGKLINTGSTTLGFIKSDTKRPCRAPEWFMSLIQQ